MVRMRSRHGNTDQRHSLRNSRTSLSGRDLQRLPYSLWRSALAPIAPSTVGNVCGARIRSGVGWDLRRCLLFGCPADTRDRNSRCARRAQTRCAGTGVERSIAFDGARSGPGPAWRLCRNASFAKLALRSEANRSGYIHLSFAATDVSCTIGELHPCTSSDESRSTCGASVRIKWSRTWTGSVKGAVAT
jgi:hypothetical protein